MKIASIQFSKNEDHSAFNCKKYGGGSVFSKWARILKNNGEDEFYDFGPKECFENVLPSEVPERCFVLNDQVLEALKKGGEVKSLLPFAEKFDFIIVNQDDCILNLNGLKAQWGCWLAFVNQTTYAPNVFIYSYDQAARVLNTAKVFKVQIGAYVPDEKPDGIFEDYLFQCTRIDSSMNPIPIVKICNKLGIKFILAGPIFHNYPILEHIDNKNSFYYGIIGEDLKIQLTKKARLVNLCHSWDTIFNLTFCTAVGQGVPVMTYNKGCFRYLVQEGINGFFFKDSEESFLDIWNRAKLVNREKIWETAKEWDHIRMVESFYGAFKKILN